MYIGFSYKKTRKKQNTGSSSSLHYDKEVILWFEVQKGFI